MKRTASRAKSISMGVVAELWFVLGDEDEGEAGEGDVGAEAEDGPGVTAKTMPFEVPVPAVGLARFSEVGAAELGRMEETRRGARVWAGERVDVGMSSGRGAAASRIAPSGWMLMGRERRWEEEPGKLTRAFSELQVRFWALKRERTVWPLRGNEKFFWAAERRRGREAPSVALG